MPLKHPEHEGIGRGRCPCRRKDLAPLDPACREGCLPQGCLSMLVVVAALEVLCVLLQAFL